MEGTLIRERYKVVRVLLSEPEYTAVQAVDIQERQRPDCLLNLYEGETLRQCGRFYADLRAEDCPGFRRVFMDGQNKKLAVVFESAQGEPFGTLLDRKKKLDREQRFAWIECLLHAALTLNNAPAEIAAAALRPENILVNERAGTLALRFVIPPPRGTAEPVRAAEARALELYPRKFCVTDAEYTLLDRMNAGSFGSLAELYGGWRKASEQIAEEYAQWKDMGFFKRMATLLLRRVRRDSGKVKQRINEVRQG